MDIGKKSRIHSRSFHHRIRDGEGHYFNENHFMGIDPMDHSKFHDVYEIENKERMNVASSLVEVKIAEK